MLCRKGIPIPFAFAPSWRKLRSRQNAKSYEINLIKRAQKHLAYHASGGNWVFNLRSVSTMTDIKPANRRPTPTFNAALGECE